MTVPAPRRAATGAAADDPAARLTGATDISAFLAAWLDGAFLHGEAAATFARYYASYRRSFAGRTRAFYASQIAEAEALVRAKPGARVLEVGCGLGTESLWLATLGADVTGIELKDDRLEVARERQSLLELLRGRALRCQFRVASLFDLPATDRYDIIWMEQTFHHLEPRADVVRKLAALLAPGGHLVISEANGWNFGLQAQLLLRRGLPRVEQLTGDDGRQHLYGVERITTATNLSRLFAAAGVARVSVRHFRMFPNRPVFQALAGVEAAPWAANIVPLFLYYNYVGVRRAGT